MSKELYITILVCIIILICWDIIDFIWSVLVKKTETAKFNIKRAVNSHATFIGGLGLYYIAFGCVLASCFVSLYKESLTDYSIYPIVDGLYWIFFLCAWAILIAVVYDWVNSIIKKQQREYDKWLDYVIKEGVWKYTDEEKVIIKKEKDEFHAKLREKFPKIAQWYDKHHKVK